MDTDKVWGKSGEDLAAAYLQEKKRYRLLTRNFRCACGEIDIIAKDGETVVFVEVKSRRSLSYGRPCEAVSRRKQAKLRYTAEAYLAARGMWQSPCRFDVIEVFAHPPRQPLVNHVMNAFWIE